MLGGGGGLGGGGDPGGGVIGNPNIPIMNNIQSSGKFTIDNDYETAMAGQEPSFPPVFVAYIATAIDVMLPPSAVSVSRGSIVVSVTATQSEIELLSNLFTGCLSCFLFNGNKLCPRTEDTQPCILRQSANDNSSESEAEGATSNDKEGNTTTIVIVVIVLLLLCILVIVMVLLLHRKQQQKEEREESERRAAQASSADAEFQAEEGTIKKVYGSVYDKPHSSNDKQHAYAAPLDGDHTYGTVGAVATSSSAALKGAAQYDQSNGIQNAQTYDAAGNPNHAAVGAPTYASADDTSGTQTAPIYAEGSAATSAPIYAEGMSAPIYAEGMSAPTYADGNAAPSAALPIYDQALEGTMNSNATSATYDSANDDRLPAIYTQGAAGQPMYDTGSSATTGQDTSPLYSSADPNLGLSPPVALYDGASPDGGRASKSSTLTESPGFQLTPDRESLRLVSTRRANPLFDTGSNASQHVSGSERANYDTASPIDNTSPLPGTPDVGRRTSATDEVPRTVSYQDALQTEPDATQSQHSSPLTMTAEAEGDGEGSANKSSDDGYLQT